MGRGQTMRVSRSKDKLSSCYPRQSLCQTHPLFWCFLNFIPKQTARDSGNEQMTDAQANTYTDRHSYIHSVSPGTFSKRRFSKQEHQHRLKDVFHTWPICSSIILPLRITIVKYLDYDPSKFKWLEFNKICLSYIHF